MSRLFALLLAMACTMALVPMQPVRSSVSRLHHRGAFEDPVASVSQSRAKEEEQPEDEEECEIDLETMQPVDPDKCL